MALINLRSDLTNKKFGNDQPGYGSSGLPYIQTSIPPTPYLLSSKGPGFPLFTPGTTGNLDYPIRGGQINFQIGQQTYTLSNQIDKTRIARFLADPSRGTLFIQKQIGLQLTNPKIETGNTLFGLGQGIPVPGLLENTRVYNRGVNTLEQVGVQGTGAHGIRHGLLPFNEFQKNYFAIVNAQNVNNEKITNRLLNLNALKMSTGTSPFVNPQNVLDINTVNTLGISLNRNLLFQYLGGPGSVYGVGTTTIKRVVDTTRLRSSRVMTYDRLREQNVNGTVTEESKKRFYNIQDFRSGSTAFTPMGIWNPQQSVDYRFYEDGTKIDKLNSSDVFVFENSQDPWDSSNNQTGNSDDLIKFVFEAISNDNTSESTAIFFRAFLLSGISDNNSATWNPFRYVGRGENFYTYQGFDRSIGFSFRVAATSEEELLPMHRRLNALVRQVYPDYGDSNFMRGPVIRVTIGDYLYRMPGFLESVNVTVNNDTPWEVDLDGTLAQLPHVLDVAVSFKPIPDYLPQRNGEGPISRSRILTKDSKPIDVEEAALADSTTTQDELTRQQRRQQRREDRRARRENRRQIAQQNKELQETGIDPFFFDPKGDILGG